MYQRILDKFYQKCKDYTIGGIVEAYVQRRSAIGEYWNYKDAHSTFGAIDFDNQWNNQPTILTDYSDNSTGKDNDGSFVATYYWNKLFIRDTSTLSFEQTQDNPRLYTITLSLDIAQYDVIKRCYLERIVVCKDAVFIVKDYNGSYFVVGETYGCRSKINFSTDAKKGDNKFNLTSICKERSLPREIDFTFIESKLLDNNTIDPHILGNLQNSSRNILNVY